MSTTLHPRPNGPYFVVTSRGDTLIGRCQTCGAAATVPDFPYEPGDEALDAFMDAHFCGARDHDNMIRLPDPTGADQALV